MIRPSIVRMLPSPRQAQHLKICAMNFIILLSNVHFIVQISSNKQAMGTLAKARKVGRIQIPETATTPIEKYRRRSFFVRNVLPFDIADTTNRRRRANKMASAVLEKVLVLKTSVTKEVPRRQSGGAGSIQR